MVLWVLPNEALSDYPEAPNGEKGCDVQTDIEIDPMTSGVISAEGGSSPDGPVFRLEKLFEEDGNGIDGSAELALLEKTLENEVPEN